ncbi:MAG: hypothetical protein HND42_01655 [Armatimonadetes bacterium]|nr:hypothetical protein [Armatimonadota bacterium]NOG91937.1 hypothetical protein [Armatimonadota bacterium]
MNDVAKWARRRPWIVLGFTTTHLLVNAAVIIAPSDVTFGALFGIAAGLFSITLSACEMLGIKGGAKWIIACEVTMLQLLFVVAVTP